MMKRIGIYSGTFDPVHVGHVTFALLAVKEANLDELYFMPERRPRCGKTPEHFGHRVAMLRRALRPHRDFKLLETANKQFSIIKTLPELQQRFPNDRLVFLFGSDVAPYISKWPHADKLIEHVEFCVGLRMDTDKNMIERQLIGEGIPRNRLFMVRSFAQEVSSTKIRTALREHQTAEGLLASVRRYAQQEWLYLKTDDNHC